MKFDYKEMTTVTVDGMRLYSDIDNSGYHYPSITTILSKTQPEEKRIALNAWRNTVGADVAEKITADTCTNGTGVHLLIERFLKGEELVQGDSFTEKMMNGFNSLKPKLKRISEVWGLEVPLLSTLIKTAGRCDCIGVYDNKPCIIDFKTSNKIKTKKDIEDYFLQLTAYSIMHNEMFNTNIIDGVILMTTGDGFPIEFKVNLLEYVEPLTKRVDIFYNDLLNGE